MADRLRSATKKFAPGTVADYDSVDQDATPGNTASLVSTNRDSLKTEGLGTSVPQLEAPEVTDPQQFHDASQRLRLTQAMHGLLGAMPVGQYGAAFGARAGQYDNGPGWQAAEGAASDQWSEEKMRVDNANKMHAFRNQYSKIKSDADNTDLQRAFDMSQQQAAFRAYQGVTSASIDAQKDIAQKRIDAAKEMFEGKTREANLKPPNDHEQMLAKLGYETEQISNKLEGLVRKNGGTMFSGDLVQTNVTDSVIGKWTGIHVPTIIRGTQDALEYRQYSQQMAAHLMQINELRRQTSRGNDYTAAWVPPASNIENEGALNLIDEGRKTGQRAYRSVINQPGGALWAYQTHSDALPWRRLIDPEVLKNSQKNRSQIARDAISGIDGYLPPGSPGSNIPGLPDNELIPPGPSVPTPGTGGPPPTTPKAGHNVPEPPGIDEFMQRHGIHVGGQ